MPEIPTWLVLAGIGLIGVAIELAKPLEHRIERFWNA